MKLKKCTVKQLKRITSKKKLVCFGAGFKLYNFFDLLKDLSLEEEIEYVIDNSKEKQGTYIRLNNKKIEVKSPEFLETLDFSKYVIVISVKKYQAIFSQIQNICGSKKVDVYLLPTVYSCIYEVLKKTVMRLPLKKYILIAYDGGTCDNTNAFGKYIRDNNYFDKYKLIWLCNCADKPQNLAYEKYIYTNAFIIPKRFIDGVQYLWWFCRAKYVINENQDLEKLRYDQISVYLNHGAPPIKATKGLIVLPDTLNYALSPSEFSSELISEQFSVNKERIVICGSPRTDVFFEIVNKDKFEKLELDRFNKVVLWAPTFRKKKNSLRDDSAAEFPYGIPVIQDENDWEKLVKALEETNVLLLLKPHKLADLSSCQIAKSENLKFITQEVLDELNANVYELMIHTDALITDYSSISFDYMLLNKPIGYTLDDKNEYKLGFSIDNPEDLMPGPKIYSVDDMMIFIKTIYSNQDDYYTLRNELKNKVHKYADGNNSKRLCEILNIV